MNTLRLGMCATASVSWSFEKITARHRLCLLNNDESGSMANELRRNAQAFAMVAAASGERFDAVIVHGFGSDSAYQVFTVRGLMPLFAEVFEASGLTHVVTQVDSAEAAVAAAKRSLATRSTHGSTCPRSHPRFLDRLGDALDRLDGSVELTVANTSDGGFDGGSPQKEIQVRMARITARCRCKLVANVLVGSAGSPSALHFFTGDPEAFDSRLLFSTTKVAAEGVLDLDTFKPASLSLDEGPEAGEDRFTLQPATAFWSFDRERERLTVYWPEDAAPVPALTLRKHQPQPGGRELVLAAAVRLEPGPVEIDRNAREVFAVIARSLSDNPYVRDDSRRSLNGLVAQLEGLLATRTAVLRTLTAPPEGRERLDALRRELDDNLRQIQAAQAGERTLRERSARINALNNARRLLKDALRETHERLDQELLERELVFLKERPDHWVAWLQPALDLLRSQLSLTQQEIGGAMQHLSTRIRTKKSREDGQLRSADRYVEALVARSRERNDRAARKADPEDSAPIERPATFLWARCPVSGDSVNEGIAGLPFVADRLDLTSGNIAAGGQNVDRIPVEADALLSLRAVRGLMWGENGQMAAPFCTPRGIYNAAIPVLLGPATRAGLRDLEKAIGWLCTGTSAFEPAMAEAIPGALAAVLGRPGPAVDPGDGALSADLQAHALLRTTALFEHFRSYPYVAGTAVLDESASKLPLPEVWAKSVEDSAAAASLQSSGCVTSLLAKTVGASRVDVAAVARGMFAWICRNVGRSVLGTPGEDGRGGVEGVRRLAWLLRLDVELAGYPGSAAADSPQARMVGGAPVGAPGARFDAPTIAAILGEELAGWWTHERAVGYEDFTEALNAWMSALPADRAMFVVERLAGVLERLDRYAPAPSPAAQAVDPGEPDGGAAQAARVSPTTHAHFDILALEAVRPVRTSTATPGLADETLELRRVLKAGETTWIPPLDARLPQGRHNPSALRFLNEHTAIQPLRALLRLHAAGCVGLPALKALRATAEARPFPRVDDVIGALARLIGGLDEVMVIAHRSLAFVVSEANGYADKHWAESHYRTATLSRCESTLGLEAAPAELPAPVHYGPRKLLLRPAEGPTWPKMIGLGYLPKGRIVDASGQTLGEPFRCTPEEAALADNLLCQRGTTTLLPKIEAMGQVVFAGLHRHARSVLGGHPQDLRALSRAELERTVKEVLVPKLAGKVRGDVHHPEFFADCAGVLMSMIALAVQLGEDTRDFRAEEPEEFLRAEAAAIRQASR